MQPQYRLRQVDLVMKDPGASGTINVDRNPCVVEVVTATAEARTLARPTKAGLIASVVLYTDGGDLTLTVTGGYNADADTSITFADAGDFVTFMSFNIGGTYYWRVIGQEGTNVASEDLTVDQLTVGTLTVGSTAVVLSDMTPGTGISPVTNSSYAANVTKAGSLYKTEILIDLTGLNSGGTAGDIIGKADTANCHIGQILAAVNGSIFWGRLTCLETPATGDDDIDLYAATESTGTEDTGIDALVEVQLCNSGNLTAGTVVYLSAFPATTKYLYLVSQTGDANATYSAGVLLLELWGK